MRTDADTCPEWVKRKLAEFLPTSEPEAEWARECVHGADIEGRERALPPGRAERAGRGWAENDDQSAGQDEKRVLSRTEHVLAVIIIILASVWGYDDK